MRAYRLACLSPDYNIGEQTGNIQYARPESTRISGKKGTEKIRQMQADGHPTFFPVSGTTLPEPAQLAANRAMKSRSLVSLADTVETAIKVHPAPTNAIYLPICLIIASPHLSGLGRRLAGQDALLSRGTAGAEGCSGKS